MCGVLVWGRRERGADPVPHSRDLVRRCLSDWLVAPVTEENATSWPVYLPALDKGARWVYHWNQSVVAAEAGWHSVDTTALADFPLFSRRPAA